MKIKFFASALICLLVAPFLTIANVKSKRRADADSHFYCVILAGGVGERLWPLSRQQKPKQLLEIQDNQTLLEQAVTRVESLVHAKNILISTTNQYKETILELLNGRIGGVIVEPGLRNTGPAILLTCLEIYERDPEAVIAFLPSDPYIPLQDNAKFVHDLRFALEHSLQNNQITLLGVRPTFPATGYGYIEFDNHFDHPPYKVIKFHEKPLFPIAQKYLASQNMLWNIGIFCGKASVFINEYRKSSSEIFLGVMNYFVGKSSYEEVKSDSIDYAIMEKSQNIAVLPVDFDWCDVGNIEVFLSVKNKLDSLKTDNIIQTGSTNNLVNVPKKLVALIGVQDLCIVETDEVLLITKREESEKVREIVKQIKQQELHEFL